MHIMRITGSKRFLQMMAATALLPLLAFCSSGEMAPPTAQATPRADTTLPLVTGAATVLINEILAHTDEPQVDTLELFNPGPAAVDLRGWCISDDEDDLRRFCIPAPAASQAPPVIAPNGFFLITAPELGYAFSEAGEEVILSAPSAGGGLQRSDRVEFGASPNGVALGRHVTSTGAVHFPLQSKVTLGAPNADPLISPVVISGIAFDPPQGPEYLVLTNGSAAPALLYDPLLPASTWRVQGIGDDGGAYKLPPQVTLQPQESVVLTADPGAFAAAYPLVTLQVLGPFDGRLNNDGEVLALQAPQPPEQDTGKVNYADMDVVHYGVAQPWPAAAAGTLVRKELLGYGNDPINWRAAATGLRTNIQLLLPLVKR